MILRNGSHIPLLFTSLLHLVIVPKERCHLPLHISTLQLILLWQRQIKLVCQGGSDSLMSDERRCLYMKVNPTFERLTAVCSNYIHVIVVYLCQLFDLTKTTPFYLSICFLGEVSNVLILLLLLLFYFLLLASLLLCTFCSFLVGCIHNLMSLQYSGLGHLHLGFDIRVPTWWVCVSDAKFCHFIPKEESEKVHKSVCLIFIIFVIIVIAFNIATIAIIVIILHNEN